MPTGPLPASMLSMTRLLARSITEIDLLSGLLTKALPARSLTTIPAGDLPTGIVAITRSSARSITLTSCEAWLVM